MDNLIENKENKLKEIGIILKSRYRGIDYVIDKIINSISTWYIFDDLLYKPTIISLFGMSGIGKTSLVRDLVKLLDMYESYDEMTVGGNVTSLKGNRSPFYTTSSPIMDMLNNATNEDPNNKGIVFIDEIHKINIQRGMFTDLWTLLSDGKLGSGRTILVKYDRVIEFLNGSIDSFYDTKNDISYAKSQEKQHNLSATESQYLMYQETLWNPTTQPIPINKKYLLSNVIDNIEFTSLDELQPLFDYNDFCEKSSVPFGFISIIQRQLREGKIKLKDILNIPGFVYIKPLIVILKNMRAKLVERYTKVTSKDPTVFSKLLIFIAGNLDGLYTDVTNIQISADELHAKTLKLTEDDLKKELLIFFKPEEVSRFGGNYIIYPSLSASAFRSIIIDKLEQMEVDIKETSGISVLLSTDKYVDYIYKIGVIASQGARPLISRIYTEINSVVPKLVKYAKLNNLEVISVDDISIVDR